MNRRSAKIMYEIGDLIIYGKHGVCKVEDIGKLEFMGVDESRTYYTLDSIHNSGKIFTPTDTKEFMRPIMAFDEVQELISKIPHIEIDEEYFDKSIKQVEESYKDCLETHDCYSLVKLIKAVEIKRERIEEQGKKLGQIDQRYLRRAEELLYGELSVVLDIPKEDVAAYIESKTQKKIEEEELVDR
jgi:CarD family transcriptional regulator